MLVSASRLGENCPMVRAGFYHHDPTQLFQVVAIPDRFPEFGRWFVGLPIRRDTNYGCQSEFRKRYRLFNPDCSLKPRPALAVIDVVDTKRSDENIDIGKKKGAHGLSCQPHFFMYSISSSSSHVSDHLRCCGCSALEAFGADRQLTRGRSAAKLDFSMQCPCQKIVQSRAVVKPQIARPHSATHSEYR